MPYTFLDTRREGPVEYLTLNRPDVRNAFNEQVIAELSAWAADARAAAERREVRAARELFLTGARFSAARAKEIGLVHTIVPAADLDATVAGYVNEILGAGPQAVAAAKALIPAVWGRPLDDATSVTTKAIAARRVSPEGQEGLNAFLGKRKPSWGV